MCERKTSASPRSHAWLRVRVRVRARARARIMARARAWISSCNECLSSWTSWRVTRGLVRVRVRLRLS